MGFSAKARRLPGRLAAGAFILNSGLRKWSADEETAARLHGMAAGTYPFLNRMKPKDFARLLSIGEIALGSALLLPAVPAAAASPSVAGQGHRPSGAGRTAGTSVSAGGCEASPRQRGPGLRLAWSVRPPC